MADPISQSRFRPTARVGGRDYGAFYTHSGGEVTNDAQKDRPPASQYGQSVPGLPAISNITMSRTFDADRDTDELRAHMRQQARIGGKSTLGIPVLDANNNPKGRETFTGIIVRYKGPDSDSKSSDFSTIELEFAVDGVA